MLDNAIDLFLQIVEFGGITIIIKILFKKKIFKLQVITRYMLLLNDFFYFLRNGFLFKGYLLINRIN